MVHALAEQSTKGDVEDGAAIRRRRPATGNVGSAAKGGTKQVQMVIMLHLAVDLVLRPRT